MPGLWLLCFAVSMMAQSIVSSTIGDSARQPRGIGGNEISLVTPNSTLSWYLFRHPPKLIMLITFTTPRPCESSHGVVASITMVITKFVQILLFWSSDQWRRWWEVHGVHCQFLSKSWLGGERFPPYIWSACSHVSLELPLVAPTSGPFFGLAPNEDPLKHLIHCLRNFVIKFLGLLRMTVAVHKGGYAKRGRIPPRTSDLALQSYQHYHRTSFLPRHLRFRRRSYITSAWAILPALQWSSHVSSESPSQLESELVPLGSYLLGRDLALPSLSLIFNLLLHPTFSILLDLEGVLLLERLL
ncbi:hypothetical protein Tco_1467775 [Tanacetum coccineum]